MSSRKDRVKKNIASKVANSKTGQTVILQSLGEEGSNLVNALAKVLTKYKSADHAKEVKSHIFKFALKAKLMADDGKFTVANTAAIGPLLMKYSDMMLIALKDAWRGKFTVANTADIGPLLMKYSDMMLIALKDAPEEKKPDPDAPSSSKARPTVAELAAHHSKVAAELGKLMNPSMQEKNQKLMQETLGAIGGEEFLAKVVEDPDYSDLRQEFSTNLDKLLETVSDPLHAHQTITSQSHFSDQYSSVIRIVRDFWSKVDRKEDEVGMSIFNKLVAAHKEYYDLLVLCKHGDDPMKQHREFLQAITHMLRMLDSWPLLTEKLKEKYPENPMKHHREFLQAITHMLRMLDSWPLPTEKLKEKTSEDPMKQHREFLQAITHMLRMLDSWPLLTEKLKEIGSSHATWAPGVSRDGYDHMAVAIHAALSEIFSKEYSNMTRKRFNTVFNLVIPILKEAY